jgi:hypothetical protein
MPTNELTTGFRPEFLDFRRGIRVGNLEENERITRILKLALESRFHEPFVTERWGRGVYWRWIGFLPRADRAAKPVSSRVSFGCAKYFISMNVAEHLFECGMQVERGYVKAPAGFRECELRQDWDWHRLIKALKPSGPMEREIRRLLRDGFRIQGGSWEGAPVQFSRSDYPGATKLRKLLDASSKNQWAGFQLYYAMNEQDVTGSAGSDLIESMLAVFDEVTPAMNLCMQIELRRDQRG